MEKEKVLFGKITRDRIIAAVFILFILIIPVMTIVTDLLPQKENDSTQMEESILEGNGTIQEGDVTTQQIQPESVQLSWFEQMQSSVNGFTERLYFRKNLISFKMIYS